MSRLSRVYIVLALTLTAATGVLLAQVSVSVKPATFKMVTLGGGGSVPTTGPVIRVAFDRTQRRYLSIDEEPLELRATIALTCGANKFTGMSLAAAGAVIPVDTIGLGKGGGGFSGTKTITTNAVTTRALDNASVPDPVALCNKDLDVLVDAGAYGKAQKGWARRFDNALPVTLSLRCVGPKKKKGGFEEPGALYEESSMTRFPVWVHCGPAAVFTSSPGSQPRAKRSSEVVPKKDPQRVPTPPQRVGSQPQRVAGSQDPLVRPDLLVLAAQAAPTSPSRLRVQIANKGTAGSPATKLALFYHLSLIHI